MYNGLSPNFSDPALPAAPGQCAKSVASPTAIAPFTLHSHPATCTCATYHTPAYMKSSTRHIRAKCTTARTEQAKGKLNPRRNPKVKQIGISRRMANSQRVRYSFDHDIDDTRINDMVMAEFGINIPPLVGAPGVVGSQDSSHDASIGPATPPGFQGSSNSNINELIHRQLYSPGPPRGDGLTPGHEALGVDRSQISTPTPFFALNDSISKQRECESQVDAQTALSLLPGNNTGVNSTPSTSSPNDLHFSSLDAAMASIPTPNWLCPLNDPSIPTNDADRQTWVLHLVNAINNTTDVVDQRSAAFIKHWLSTPPFYHPAAIELLAWDILALAEDMHSTGPIALHIADAKQTEHVRKTRDWTFARRILSIIALLTNSKSRCEKCINRVNVAMVVGNPEKLLKGSKGNRVQNGKRQELLHAGREIRKRRKLELGAGGGGS